MFRYLLSGVVILFTILACSQEQAVWNPVVEQTHFDYIGASVSRAISGIDAATAAGDADNWETGGPALKHARRELMAIKDYYLPLTAVRQFAYDAERLVNLKQPAKAKALIERAKGALVPLEQFSDQEQVALTVEQLLAIIEECLLSMDHTPDETTAKLKSLGEKVNLMLYKGELILSGVEFN